MLTWPPRPLRRRTAARATGAGPVLNKTTKKGKANKEKPRGLRGGGWFRSSVETGGYKRVLAGARSPVALSSTIRTHSLALSPSAPHLVGVLGHGPPRRVQQRREGHVRLLLACGTRADEILVFLISDLNMQNTGRDPDPGPGGK